VRLGNNGGACLGAEGLSAPPKRLKSAMGISQKCEKRVVEGKYRFLRGRWERVPLSRRSAVELPLLQ